MKTKIQFADIITLETDRLILRKLTLDDADDIFQYASDPEVARYLPWDHHKSVEDSRSFINSVLTNYENREPATWGIEHKMDGKIIGTAGFTSWSPNNLRGEIGYALSRKYWGRGIMTEVVRRIVSFGFQVMTLNRVDAICEIDNSASARILEKVGMTYEGILRSFMYNSGTARDMKMYSILKSEWAA